MGGGREAAEKSYNARFRLAECGTHKTFLRVHVTQRALWSPLTRTLSGTERGRVYSTTAYSEKKREKKNQTKISMLVFTVPSAQRWTETENEENGFYLESALDGKYSRK